MGICLWRVGGGANHLAMSLSHAGYGGGITQFNKLSRFVDRPNVLAKLDRGDRPTPEAAAAPVQKPELPPVVYDKPSLLAKVLSLFQKD